MPHANSTDLARRRRDRFGYQLRDGGSRVIRPESHCWTTRGENWVKHPTDDQRKRNNIQTDSPKENDNFDLFQLLINVVPKMIDHGTSGKFALVRNCRPPRRQLQDENAFGVVATGEYDDLLEQLLISASTNNGSREAERPNIDLIQLYCHGGRVEEVAASVVNAIESGKRGTVDISQSDLWTFLIR